VRRLTFALAAIFAVLGATAAQGQAAEAGQAIPNRYIVTVEDGFSPKGVAANQDADPTYVYRGVLNGFAAKLDRGQLRALRRSGKVARVEADRVVTASATQNMDATGQPWGLDRIDQRNLPLSRTYTYNRTGSGVFAYVIDTGIRTTHADFGGRAQNVYDAFGGNGQDCHGHGTHVAGTVGGTIYGVAKGVQLRGLRVLNCSGSGSTSGIIAALNWLRTNAQRPAVANMSLGGGFSSSMNTATANLANSGVFVAVAAGNENQNACNVSPASTPVAYTTAASDSTDLRASFSNWGSCVDGYAPGVSIKSAWRTSNTSTNTISGTSMASPHVAGVGALYKSNFGEASSATVSNWINTNATANVIRSNRTGTPNRLLYKAGL
jgi:subtilisin family serine protease